MIKKLSSLREIFVGIIYEQPHHVCDDIYYGPGRECVQQL